MRWWDRFLRLVDLTSAVLVVAMVVIVAVQILLRYLFGRPFVWADELANWLFVWVIYLSASVLVHRDAHLTVDVVVQWLSPRVNRWRKLGVNLLVLAFLALLFVQAIGLLEKFAKTPSPAMLVPMGFFFGTALVFSTIAIVEYVRQTIVLAMTMVRSNGASTPRR